MTAPPLPASPCLRARLVYTNADSSLAGSRFYLSYAGAAPTAGNCITLASDIATAWSDHIADQISVNWSLTEVDVLDIASLTGASGQWEGSEEGTISGVGVPSQCAMNVEFGIARRYRGGKPRMFLPGGGESQLASTAKWTTDYVAAVTTAVTDFFSAIEALSIGAVGALAHVNLSYYTGFKNIANSSGRERAVPQYRPLALLDTINGYFPKAVIGSQRRRRTATSA